MQKLNTKAVWLLFVESMMRWVFICFMLFASFIRFFLDGKLKEDLFIWLFVGTLIFLLLNYLWAELSYSFYKYQLKDEVFYKEYGVIWKNYVTIPYDRIQNVDINRGIVARILGLSVLNIQTAGAGVDMGAEGSLIGISKEIAEQLRDELINKARQSRKTNQGL